MSARVLLLAGVVAWSYGCVSRTELVCDHCGLPDGARCASDADCENACVGGTCGPHPGVSTASPVVFFTDLKSGPNTGGEADYGTILTIYGKGFGAVASTVTVGGGAVAHIYEWGTPSPGELGLEEIKVGLGAAATSGAVVVTVAGTASTCANDGEGCDFIIADGNIWFVSPSGADTDSGSFDAPWQTLYHAVRSVGPGDLIYAMDGVSLAGPDCTGWHTALLLTTSSGGVAGALAAPIGLVAYPGASVTVGTSAQVSGCGDTATYGIRGDLSYWVLAGLALRGSVSALSLGGNGLPVSGPRIVGNDISADDPGSVSGSAVELIIADHVSFFGNWVHDIPHNSSNAGQAVAFLTDTNHVWAGWNTVANNTTCFGMQFYSWPQAVATGYPLYDLHVHDNFVHDGVCAGLDLVTVDPSRGPVEVFNNVVFHTGLQGQSGYPDLGSNTLACVYLPGYLGAGTAGSGEVQLYNNTMFDCGPASTGGQVSAGVIAYAGSQPDVHYRLSNNILATVSPTQAYLAGDVAQFLCADGANDLFGNGTLPDTCMSGNLDLDPMLASPATMDFHLTAGGPLAGAGTSLHTSAHDLDGLPRSSPPAVGAYEPAPR